MKTIPKNIRGRRVVHICEFCDEPFEVLQVRLNAGRRCRFCSSGCYSAHRRSLRQDKRFLARKHQRKSKYGISGEEFRVLLSDQGGGCAICESKFDGTKRVYVDHSHLSGKVRGLLCVRCNSMLGMARDSAQILDKGIRYLENQSRRP